MGQTFSFQPDFARFVHDVPEINHQTLSEKISELIQKSKFPQDCNAIAEKALSCLYEMYKTDFQSNCEVIIDIENIGQMCIKSGNGAYKVAVIGDVINCQAILLEYRISTLQINGLLIDSLFRFCTKMPVYPLNEVESDHMKKTFNEAKQFVQMNPHLDWYNARVDFNGAFPLQIISGRGETCLTIMEIRKQLTNDKILRKMNTEVLTKTSENIIDITIPKFDARELGKLRIKYCGNEGAHKTKVQQRLEEQFTALTDFYKQNQKENFWQKCVVDIISETTIYRVCSGDKKKKRIVVLFYDEQPHISMKSVC